MVAADKEKGTPRFDAGDVEIAVQWYGRVAGSASPRKYRIEANEATRSVSSTILLAAGQGIATQLAGPCQRRAPPRSPAGKQAEIANEAKRVWGLQATAESLALVERYVNQRE